MKFTLNWLKDHLETKASLDDISETLSRIGLEVEGIDNPGEKLGAFTIARVVDAAPHPNADKLRVCKVDTGKGVVQVVCGAPNARTGLIGVFAAPGTFVPGSNFTLGSAKIRGVDSAGMLCSERELELSSEHDGIIELPESAGAYIGQRFADAMGLNDPVIEIAITPNRPDCLGVRGIARDLAAAGLGTLKKERLGYQGEGEFKSPIRIELQFDKNSADACPVFAGRLIRGVKNGPSPAWLQQRLKAIGLRPLNALVDITNYISYDRCRPLHVYDADKLHGAIHARLGRDGEKFAALDGKTYAVDGSMCVIADAGGVLGLGGVIGGEASGCTGETVNVFIESAYFDPVRIAATGRKTGITSDARFRFERGIDPQSAELGIALATEMILEMCGGTPSRLEMAGKPPLRETVIAFDPKRVEALTGLKLKPGDIVKPLKKLGFEIENEGARLRVTAPSWRPDIHGPADLVEEVIRLYGIDNVPLAPLPRAAAVRRFVPSLAQTRLNNTQTVLASRGLIEAITWSFIPRAHAERFGGGAPGLELANPISRDMSSMRPSLIPGLLAAASGNLNRGLSDVGLFETGQIFQDDSEAGQLNAAAGVRLGLARIWGAGRHWDGAAKEAGVFDAKADVFAVLAASGFDPEKAQIGRDVPGWLHPGRSGSLRLGPKLRLGVFGELHPETAAEFGLSGTLAVFEVFLDAIPEPRRKATQKPPLDLSGLQPVKRDYAFVLKSETPAAAVVKAARAADSALITQVNVFDVFEGGNLGAGKKSLAIEVTLQPREKTLTDGDIEAVSAKIIERVRQATGGEIRT